LLLSVIGLSQQYLESATADPGYYQVSAGLALSQQFWAARLAALAYLVATPLLSFQPGQLLVIPIILWELVFATWLIVRGFRFASSRGGSRGCARRMIARRQRPREQRGKGHPIELQPSSASQEESASW
jgi:hypothetical protein